MKIRVANYYENRLGRNDGNPLYMYRAFKDCGVESGHLIPHGDISKFGSWDLHFEADWAEDALKGILPYTPVPIPSPSAFWHSDTHLGYDWRLEKAKRTDYNFVCQKADAIRFQEAGIKNVFYMPHAVEPLAYPAISSLKKYDISFIGHINSENRIEALDRIYKEIPNFFYGQRLFEQAAEIYSQSKIVFNISINNDLNMRTFEGMSTKSFMLTSYNEEVASVFEDGKHLVLYKSLDEAVEKARYYLAHDEEREKIAQSGYEEVRSKHTFVHRALQVLDTCIPEWNKTEQPKELAAVA